MRTFLNSKLIPVLICLNFLQISTVSAKDLAKENKFILNWSIAHGPFNLVKKATLQFKQKVEARTKGNVKVSIETTNNNNPYLTELDSNSKELSRLIAGKVQMAQIYTSNTARYYPKLGILSLPFIFENDEHVFKVLDSDIGKDLAKGLLESSGMLRSLAYTYCGGFRVVATKDIELNSFEDFSKLTLAYPTSVVLKEAYTALNIKTYATRKFETLANINSSAINGFESTYPRYANSGEMKTVKVVNDFGLDVLISSLVINDGFFQSLPKEYQTIITEEAMSAAIVERAESIRISEEIKSSAKKLNFKIVKMPKSELQKAIKATEIVYHKFESLFGGDVIKQIIEFKSDLKNKGRPDPKYAGGSL